MNNECKEVVKYAIPFLLSPFIPTWVAAWYWRYYAFKGVSAFYRFCNQYYRVYGIATPWSTRPYNERDLKALMIPPNIQNGVARVQSTINSAKQTVTTAYDKIPSLSIPVPDSLL
jgi:hypothetical protein